MLHPAVLYRPPATFGPFSIAAPVSVGGYRRNTNGILKVTTTGPFGRYGPVTYDLSVIIFSTKREILFTGAVLLWVFKVNLRDPFATLPHWSVPAIPGDPSPSDSGGGVSGLNAT